MQILNEPISQWLESKSLVPMLLGPVFLFISLVLFFNTLIFLVNSERVEGRVVDLVLHSSDVESQDEFVPVVNFTTKSGVLYQYWQPYYSDLTPSYEIGDPVGVFYRPGNPKKLRLDEFFPLWGYMLIFAALGFGALYVGLQILLKERPYLRKFLPRWSNPS